MAQIDEKITPSRDIRQSPGYAKFMREIGWQVDRIGETVLLSRRLPVLGTLVKIQRPNLPLPLEEINRFAQDKKAFLVKIEPNFLIDGFDPQVMGGFRKDGSPILPTRTIWVDLGSTEETLFGNLEKDTRNLVRRSEKEKVAVLESKDLKDFYRLWEENAKQKGFFAPFEKELAAMWRNLPERKLLVAKCGGKIVAGALLFGYDRVLYYFFAGSSETGRRVHAPYLLLWEVISRSKKWGYERLDLEGITDPKVGRTKSWAGFSHFKKGFGGREVEYAGSFSKFYSPLGKLLGRFI